MPESAHATPLPVTMQEVFAPPAPSAPPRSARFTVYLAAHHGLCFGVRDALAQAEKLAAAGPLTVLGELAHNPAVRARLEHAGIRQADLAAVGSAATARVMTTAHGAAPSVMAAWRRAGHTVIDGACPLVRHAHRELGGLVAQGFHPLIIGKPGHPEVLGLCTDHPGAAVVDTIPDLAHIPAHDRYGVISQTTQPIGKVRAMVAELKRLHPHADIRFRDTVCQPTKDRQRALGEVIATCEVVVVVGGRGSNNTRELVASCRAGGRVAHQVESAEDLDPQWFSGVTSVGLTAGTSTLPATIAAVHARLLDVAATPLPASRIAPTDTELTPIAAPLPPVPAIALIAKLPPQPPSPFAAWLRYFQGNCRDRREPDWNAPVVGESRLISLIATSLAHLQLGESGEGTVLLHGAARIYADDPDYTAALALFIAEEREHARLLARSVQRLGGSLVQRHWTHACFRSFRHALGPRFELQILLIAEIVGTAFYRLLRKHGGDPVVSAVCDLLLTDEDQHLAFHRERFRADHAGWSSARRWIWLAQVRFVLHCAGMVAWWDFAPTVKALGATRKDFCATLNEELRRVVD